MYSNHSNSEKLVVEVFVGVSQATLETTHLCGKSRRGGWVVCAEQDGGLSTLKSPKRQWTCK